MEQIVPQAFNPHLKKVLKTYQTAAERSLSGPQNYVAAWGDALAKLSPAELEEYRKVLSLQQKIPIEKGIMDIPGIPYIGPVNFQQMPLLIPRDTTYTEKTETILEGETIACFVVGGEKRLCLPQILNTVLRDFNLQEINTVCDDLHIFCSRCSAEQLETLKITNVLPPSAPSCGLITKTDAERLCNALLHRELEKSKEARTPNSFKVYHECFGKCKGIFSPEKYTSPHAKCIVCTDCHGLLSPQKFVCHSHKALENRTCHWGFDSANWRAYILLAKDQENRERAQRALEDMKARFDFMSRYKRKDEQDEDNDFDPKRPRYDENGVPKYEAGQPSDCGQYRQVSAFRPWSPSMLSMLKDGKFVSDHSISRSVPSYLQTGPPVLLNPERVVPFSKKLSFDRHFAPNVSLAPQAQVKEEKDEKVRSRCSMAPPQEDIKPPPDLMLSSSSSSSSENCTPSPSKTSHAEHEASDVEDSFKTEPVPSIPRDERHASQLFSSHQHQHVKEVEMLKHALDGKVGASREAKEKFIQEFMCLRIQDDDKIRSMASARREMMQEIEFLRVTSKEKLREAEEAKLELRKEIDRLRIEQDMLIQRQIEELRMEHDDKIQMLQKENISLKREIEAIKTQQQEVDVEKIDTGFNDDCDPIIDEQRNRELAKLRQQLKKSGVSEGPLPLNPASSDNGLDDDTDQTDTAEEENCDNTGVRSDTTLDKKPTCAS